MIDKQEKKKLARSRLSVRNRVSDFRDSKKAKGEKVMQFYINDVDKSILDEYKASTGLTSSEVFSELINKILRRRMSA